MYVRIILSVNTGIGHGWFLTIDGNNWIFSSKNSEMGVKTRGVNKQLDSLIIECRILG